MKQLFIAIVIILLLHKNSFAQKAAFGSQNTIGLLEGSKGSAFQFQTIMGVRYTTWFAGIGSGFDYYHLRSIPLFFSLQKDFFPKLRTPFIHLNGGTNFFWDKNESGNNNWIDKDYKPKLYYAAGIGYKFGLKNKDAFLLDIGYSFKHLREVRTTQTFCLNPPCLPTVERFDYELRRLLIRFGYMF